MHAVLALGLLLAQAEPAPAPPPPPPGPAPVVAPAVSEGKHAISVFLGESYRLASGDAPGPASGFSVGGTFERLYLRLGPPDGTALVLGASLSFFHDHFTQGLSQAPDDRVLTQTGFVVAQTAAVPFSGVTPWIAIGAGLTIAYFSTPETALSPGSASAHQPVLAGGVGLDVAIKPGLGIRARVNITHTLTRPTFVTASGSRLDLFGDLLDSGIGLFYRF